MDKHGQRYEKTVLIKLRRNYGKDETILWALNKITSLKIEVGVLRAEVHELKNSKINPELKEKLKNQIIHEISSTTLLGYTPTYDEYGNCLSVDPNTKKHSYLCCECNNQFSISGNNFKGWKYGIL